MSTSTISVNSFNDGLLTDVTSIAFASEDGTFGIKRTDTGASVVSFGTAVAKISTGVYQYSFSDPGSGLEYEMALKIVYAGVTYYYYRLFEGSSANVTSIFLIPSSDHYSSQAEVTRQLGTFALQLMSEDWDQEDTSSVWDDILEEVDEMINIYIGHKYPVDSFTNRFLRRLATKMTCYLFSGRRGNPHLYRSEYLDAQGRLEEIRKGSFNIPGLIPNGNFGPVVRNYQMQPVGYHPMRVEQTKSTGDTYSRMDFAFEPYFLSIN